MCRYGHHRGMNQLQLLIFFAITHVALCQFALINKQLPSGGQHGYRISGDMRITFKDSWNGYWNFGHPSSEFYLSFTSVEFHRSGTQCNGELQIRTNIQRSYHCSDTTELLENIYTSSRQHSSDNSIYIYASYVHFSAVITFCKFAGGVCHIDGNDNGHENLYIVHTLSPNQTIGQITDYEIVEPIPREASSEIIAFEGMRGSVCSSCSKILLPISDIPSCSADVPETCEWIGAVSADFYNRTNRVSGKAFRVYGIIATFKTMSTNLHLEKTCLSIQYISNGTSNLRVFIGYNGDENDLKLLSSFTLEKTPVLTTRRLISEVPEHLKGTPLQIIIQISETNNPCFIKQIYGCNPYIAENRFPVQHSYNNEGYALNQISIWNRVHNIYQIKGLPMETCLNGGRKYGDNCLCPAGFTGEKCQIACGENKFGPNCEAQCSFDDNKCKRLLFCRMYLGCMCAPGWMGTYCEERCPGNLYGIDCQTACGQCSEGTPCDMYTGICRMGCRPGYIPPLCQSKYAHILQRPVVSDIGYTSAIVAVNVSTNINNEIKFYLIQYSNNSLEKTVWFETPMKQLPSDRSVREELLFLKPGVVYRARMIVFNDDMSSYEGDDLPTVLFTTRCIEHELYITERVTESEVYLEWRDTTNYVNSCGPSSYEVDILLGPRWKSYLTENSSIILTSLLPGSKYLIRIRRDLEYAKYHFKTVTTLRQVTGMVDNLGIKKKRYDSIELSWDNDKPQNSSFIIEYQCLMMLSCRQACRQDRGSLTVNSSPVTIDGLRPYRKYSFRVKVVPGPNHSEIVANTNSAVPGAIPKFVSVVTTNSSLTITWSPPEDCSDSNGFVTGYYVKALMENKTVLVSEETTNTYIVKNYLTPGTLYRFYVYIINFDGRSSVPLVVDAVTKTTAPSSVRELAVYKVGRQEVGLRWSRPENLFGSLDSFGVGPVGQTLLYAPAHCDAWPNQYCHTLTGLKPETNYNFSVYARNENVDSDGAYSFISATTVEKAPGEPLNLTVYNETETSISLSWAPPKFFNGILRSFLVKIDQTESHTTECCEYYPKVEMRVEQEQALYATEVKGLKGGSVLAVSVMGETVWLGPAARVTACTRPPPPPTLSRPPAIDIDPSTNISWTENSSSVADVDMAHLIRGHLVLLLAEDEEGAIGETDWKDEQLKGLIDSAFPGERYCVAAQYQEGVPVELSNGEDREGEWSSLGCGPLLPGSRYQLAVVTVAKYCHLYNIATLRSNPFVVS